MTSKEGADTRVSQAGDLVKLEFDLWAEGAGKTELIDTTHEDVAQSAGVTSPAARSWGPRPYQIGDGGLPAGIDASLVGLKIGEEVEREFAPGQAFGERDPNLIELFSMHEIERLPEMRREDAHLDLGTILTINGRRGRVVTLTAARVRVDFNPPFAGRKVRAKFRIVERIVEPADRARAVVEVQYGHGQEFHVEFHEKTVTLKVPDRTKFDLNWFAAKARIVEQLRSQVHAETIRFVEEWTKPVEETKAAPAREASAPAAAAGAEKETTPAPKTKAGGAKRSHPADASKDG